MNPPVSPLRQTENRAEASVHGIHVKILLVRLRLRETKSPSPLDNSDETPLQRQARAMTSYFYTHCIRPGGATIKSPPKKKRPRTAVGTEMEG